MRKLHLSKLGVFAGLLAAVLLYWSVRGMDWKAVGSSLLSANAWGVGGCYACASAALFLRSYRWRVLLRAGAPVTVSLAFWATAAGYFGNNFLPARAGELVRTFMIASQSPLKKAFVLTTALSERVFDALTLVVMAGAAMGFVPRRPSWMWRASWGFAAVGVAGVVGIVLLPRLEGFGLRMLARVPLAARWKDAAHEIVEQIALGLRPLHSARRLLQFTTLTGAIWSMDAAAAIAASRALHMHMPVFLALLLIAALGLGSALPGTPGYVGIYQFVAVGVLTPFGFTRSSSIAFIILAQAVSYLVVGVWGAIGLIRSSGLSARRALETL